MWDAAVLHNRIKSGVQRGVAAASGTAEGARRPAAADGAAQQAPDTDLWSPVRQQTQEDEAASLWEMIQQAQARAEETREKFSKLKAPVNYGDIPIQASARLARARTRGDVGAAEGYARRQIARLKGALRQDCGSSDAIRAAIVQLEKTVCRAGRKKRQLDKERLLQLRQRKAREQERSREELRLRQELRRRLTSRSIQEGGYVREAVVDSQMRSALAAESAKWQLNTSQTTSPAQGVASYTASAIAAEPPASPAGGGVELQA